MKNNNRESKDQRITIRLTQSELESLEKNIEEAGYKTAGAFIRDFVASLKPKAKVSGDVVLIARELMSLSALVNASATTQEINRKIKEIDRINTGDAV